MIPNPSIEQLAYIAVKTAAISYQLTNKKPRVAFLSYTSHSSKKNPHPSVEKIKLATQEAQRLAKDYNFDMEIDGELQMDAALDPRIAENKSISGSVAGNANVLNLP